MRILILEDEPLIARSLVKEVRHIEPEAVLEGPLESISQALQWFAEHPQPDLILADIQLSDGVSFDIFRQVPTDCPLIFTTAYDAYAIRAFKLNSVDYLLKPIGEEELRCAFEKFHRLRESTPLHYPAQLSTLLEQLEKRPARVYKRRFLAHHHRTIVAVPTERVALFVRDEVIWLVTTEGERLITDYPSLDELDDLLDPADFFRASRQHTVRKEALEGYRTHYSGRLELLVPAAAGEAITVSKEKAPFFRRWFEE
ncbi:LytTR family DNA-binding domain-containing protein [Rhabdobacter roseus]|uniref:DNA-binding LytR/AlgR family response regulator n=1 Tax=Rhabdobacter roseus TaxID=1655419 RepID=A0A840TZ93_9BACT|nr:LytTR family DNA-binding domain-containing protein [Rhabdobacter roseus]MBB5285508.1 DNA-binding LytR/AlgR family response regulator [Rhabdobacter roseus]